MVKTRKERQVHGTDIRRKALALMESKGTRRFEKTRYYTGVKRTEENLDVYLGKD